jgi:hypothetical protein
MKTIYLEKDSKEQFKGNGINPWNQPVSYTEFPGNPDFPYEIELREKELCAISDSRFDPQKVPDLEDIILRMEC